MKKIAVFIENNSKELILDESLVVTQDSYTCIYVKTASIYWNYVFFSGYNDTVVYSFTTVKFEPGYWTFYLIKKKLEALDGNLTINSNTHNNTCTVTTDANLQLKCL